MIRIDRSKLRDTTSGTGICMLQEKLQVGKVKGHSRASARAGCDPGDAFQQR
jgi:hypothetical protein